MIVPEIFTMCDVRGSVLNAKFKPLDLMLNFGVIYQINARLSIYVCDLRVAHLLPNHGTLGALLKSNG